MSTCAACAACGKAIRGVPVTFTVGGVETSYHPGHAPETVAGVAGPPPASFPPTEIGLMTRDEFLHFRNPEGRSHGADSYDFDLAQLNREYASTVGTAGWRADEAVTVQKVRGGLRMLREGKLIAYVRDGVAYYDKPHLKNSLPRVVYDIYDNRQKPKDLGIVSFQRVKYLSEMTPIMTSIAATNEERFPVVLQRIVVKGEPMTVRAETPEQGIDLAIVNRDGLVVARASNEWGATLLTVAQEYRGKGLGKIIGWLWYERNPTMTSGGFTRKGQDNAVALWNDRVRDFGARGWYSALVREGRLSKARVKAILAGVAKRAPTPAEEVPKAKAPKEILVYVDPEGVSFVVYDKRFLEDQDATYIHGYGFFRDAPRVGTFLYRIDYDRPFAAFVTEIALQMARDNGEDIYDAPDEERWHDLLEIDGIDGIPSVVREGKHIKVTEDLLPLKAMARKERQVRKAADRYGETLNALVETAEGKWS